MRSVVLYATGVGILLLALPHEGYNKATYVSENALTPGAATDTFGRDAAEVALLLGWTYVNGTAEAAGAAAARIAALGWDLVVEEQGGVNGTNVYGVLRAPRGDGTESLMLSAPWSMADGRSNTAGVALLLALAAHFTASNFWAKDVIVLLYDGPAGMHRWLEEYHGVCLTSPSFNGGSNWKCRYLNSYCCIAASCLDSKFVRAGAIQASLNLELGPDVSKISGLGISPEGTSSRLPNLDLLNTFVRLAQLHHVPLYMHEAPVLVDPLWKTALLPLVGGDVSAHVEALQILAVMMWNQATGLSSVSNGAVHKYKIDAFTVRAPSHQVYVNSIPPVHIARAIEGTVRSCNNLLEHFHQSFFFYLLPSPWRYVSIGLYMPAFIALVAPLALTAIALWIEAGNQADPAVPLVPPIALIEHTPRIRALPASKLAFTQTPRPVLDLAIPLLSTWAAPIPIGLYPTMTSELSRILCMLAPMALLAYGFVPLLVGSKQHHAVYRAIVLAVTSALLCGVAGVNFSLGVLLALGVTPLLLLVGLPHRSTLFAWGIQVLAIALLFGVGPVYLAVGVLAIPFKQLADGGALLVPAYVVVYLPALIASAFLSFCTN